MPRQPEGKLVAKVKDLIKDKGGRPFKIQGTDDTFQEVGIPDILCCYRGLFVGLEAKLPGGKPTPKQLRVLDEIAEAGGIAVVFTTVGQVASLLGKIDREVERAAHRLGGTLYRYDLPGDQRHRRQS
jgi:hypothetical protein